jgi:hypothetical protein
LPWNPGATRPETSRSTGTHIAELNESAFDRHLSHCDGTDHLNGVGGSGLAKLPAGCRRSLVFRAAFVRALRLAVQTELLKRPSAASGAAWPSLRPAAPSGEPASALAAVPAPLRRSARAIRCARRLIRRRSRARA